MPDATPFTLWAWIVDQRRDLDSRADDWRAKLADPQTDDLRRRTLPPLIEFAQSFARAVDEAGPGDAWKIWDRFVGRERREWLPDGPSLLNMVVVRSPSYAELLPGDPRADIARKRTRAETEARDHFIRELHAAIESWTGQWPGRKKRPTPLGRTWFPITTCLLHLFDEDASMRASERLYRAEAALLLSDDADDPRLAEIRRQLEAEVESKVSWADAIAAYVLGPDAAVDARGIARICGRR